MTTSRARHYARAILEVRTAGRDRETLNGLITDAAANEPAGVIALLARAAADGISDAVLGEGERWGNSDTYISDALAYLWENPDDPDPRA
jgi:hypothetical protein